MHQLKTLVELLVEQEFKTKLDEPIEFKVYEQSPRARDDLGRGWIVHKIEAFVDGEEVDHIKMSYIPKARFKEHYKSIVQFIDKMKGQSIYPGKDYDCPHPCSDHFDDLPLPAQVRALARLNYSTRDMFYQRNTGPKVTQPEDMDESELKELKEKCSTTFQNDMNINLKNSKSFITTSHL